MTRPYKIAIVISSSILIILVVSVVFVLYKNPTNNANIDQNTNQTLNVGLTDFEKKELVKKVSYFVEFYNSYGYNDYNSTMNVADVGTIDFQYQAIARKEYLEQSTAEGYSILVTPRDETFSYQLVGNSLLEVTISADVVEQTLNTPVKKKVQKYSLSLVKDAGEWRISKITP